MDKDYIRLREIKPELARYLSDSLVILKRSPVPDDASVHDLRVLLKKSRSALRLMSNLVNQEYNRKDIESLRRAATLMAGWRDNSVLRKTLKEIRKDHTGLFMHLQDNDTINKLLSKPEIPAENQEENTVKYKEITSLIRTTAYRIRFQNTSDFDPHILLKELEDSYLSAVEKFVACRNSPGEKKLHTFRKKAKNFLFQLYFFRPLNNKVIKNLEKKLDIMTRNLGKINDLNQVIKVIGYKYERENAGPVDELVVRIREKQDSYLEKVWPVASKIFCPGKKLVNVLGYKLLVI